MQIADTEPTSAPPHRASVAATTAPIALVPRTRKRLRKTLFYTAMAIVPGAVGAAIGALTRSKRAGALAAGTTLVGMGLVRLQLQRWWSDEPTSTVEQTFGAIEVRQYAAYVVAQTELTAPDANAATQAGFGLLFPYLGGSNATSEKLAMTAPVITQRTGDTWTVSFVMPAGRSLASLPAPTDHHVTLAEVAPRRMAVLTYRGRFHADAIEQHERELARSTAFAGFTVTGEPAFAGFDPPTTVSPLRRNEAWIELLHG